MTGIADAVRRSTELRKPLTALINKGCVPVGGIYRLDYDSAIVLTDDFKKHKAGGVPRGGFLLAVAGENTESGFMLEDQEVILLRVRGTAPLPNESELIQTRLAVVRDAGASGVGFDDVTDVLTRNELQQSAFDCEVLGTFYTETDARDAQIEYGADIDNVVVSARYQVFLPSIEVLSWLASYPEPVDNRDALAIGKVRFAATRRKALVAGTDQADVRVDVSDFIGRKTAVFGMTRTGKSNTIKTLVTAVHRYGSEHKRSIGQLIFDPQGEYANVNKQDKTGLRLLGDDDNTVRIYKVEPNSTDIREKPLRINFYDREVLDAGWSLVSEATAPVNTNYSKDFRSAVLSEPDRNDRSAYNRWGWAMVAFYGLLAKCGFQGSSLPQELIIAAQADPMNAFMAANSGAVIQAGRPGSYRVLTSAGALALAEWVGERPGEFPKWHERSNCHFVDIWSVYKYTGVTSAIRSIRAFHGAQSAGDVGEHLWQDMLAGRLAIVDLSSGNDKVAKVMSERIVTHLLNRASERFRADDDPVDMQIIVEEAHNLFERGGRDVADDPWVRLSKEAAKYRMGLIYATQEVTSVDKRILSNTSNWLIAHLNSDHETRELAHYYDFKVWAPSIMRAEDIGFVRMKTYSGKFIVPVQVAKFDHAMVNNARNTAGLASIDFQDEGE
ncbi:ATP-binding protein [Streptosporangium sp. NPDC000509]|uniref:ATP-binding protein n=1 Tax=Streptosporangium sp. NPDC000509 TaxID=3366186 RepID=UPI0036C1F7E4